MMKRKNVIFAFVVFSVSCAAAWADSARDVALAYEEYQQLENRLDALFANPERQVRALCGASSGVSVYEIAADSFAALSEEVEERAEENHVLYKLASAYYGRSKIYADRAFAPYMHERQFSGRLYGNDKRIEGIMRGVYNARGGVRGDDSIRRQAQKTVEGLLAADEVCR